ncbi:MAG: glycosyltransferase, partial [Fimbriimonadaceae bacterium]
AQVKQLAEFEMQLGFRSCFNFIPKGPYDVPADLRRWLISHGFEVGVHDLHHDGHLFNSRSSFERKAAEINRHLQHWGSRGFRAGFMLRNLEWQHQLDIEYDSSTFDTDPFELQSDGVGTIFPFWITDNRNGSPGNNGTAEQILQRGNNPNSSSKSPKSARKGYVELPYTLPQDSTLFLVLAETTADIWLRKVDWVAKKGGMALVNVHPDYVDFSGGGDSRRKYPLARYAELLNHVLDNYTGQFYHRLPIDVSTWFKSGSISSCRMAPTLESGVADGRSALKGKRAAVLLYSEYPADPRPRRAAEAMIEAGMEVDLHCLAGSSTEPCAENVGGVNVFRQRIKRSRDSKIAYLWKYAAFITSSFWFLMKNSVKRKYDVIHVHNMPDVLVFSTMLTKLFGTKVILDLHDPMPEVMMTIYGLEENKLSVRLLKQMEKWSIGFSDTVITVNEACRRIFSARSCSNEKVNVIMNSPDEGLFGFHETPRRSPRAPSPSEPFVIMYHGSIVERHGLDIAVQAFARLRRIAPFAELRIYGNETPFLHKILDSITDPALRQSVRFLGPKNLGQIVTAIRECDVGIIPNRRS